MKREDEQNFIMEHKMKVDDAQEAVGNGPCRAKEELEAALEELQQDETQAGTLQGVKEIEAQAPAEKADGLLSMTVEGFRRRAMEMQMAGELDEQPAGDERVQIAERLKSDRFASELEAAWARKRLRDGEPGD